MRSGCAPVAGLLRRARASRWPRRGRARTSRATLIARFERANVDAVVVNAAGCGSAMKSTASSSETIRRGRARAQAFRREGARTSPKCSASLGAPQAPRHRLDAARRLSRRLPPGARARRSQRTARPARIDSRRDAGTDRRRRYLLRQRRHLQPRATGDGRQNSDDAKPPTSRRRHRISSPRQIQGACCKSTRRRARRATTGRLCTSSSCSTRRFEANECGFHDHRPVDHPRPDDVPRADRRRGASADRVRLDDVGGGRAQPGAVQLLQRVLRRSACRRILSCVAQRRRKTRSRTSAPRASSS